jgi:hypothetical protein
MVFSSCMIFSSLHILSLVTFLVARNCNHKEHALAVFNRNAHKVIKDTVSYARIQANNQYYKEVLHQKMSKKLSSSAIYLTKEQYCQVKNPKSFDIQHLRLVAT